MDLHAATAQLAHGMLIGGAIGEQQTSLATKALSQHGVRAIDRMTEMLMPGILTKGRC
jgi:hypothetical protein